MSSARRTRPLAEIAKTIRSKNAGVDKITFDIIFSTRAATRISDHVEFVPALAIKFTISRDKSSGTVLVTATSSAASITDRC